jgi:hypothetical protein
MSANGVSEIRTYPGWGGGYVCKWLLKPGLGTGYDRCWDLTRVNSRRSDMSGPWTGYVREMLL